ncbi:phosphopantetheine-binding protein, partial [Rhodococcus sp. HNM0569]|uniref:phosphopantetheine-binding protein n=1 Tax=Rhodococcus sp. HNM0569 TaxID=2716340 RepID=UPI001F11544E
LGVESDFFALGGDSIVSMTLVRRAAKRGITFTARDVFEHRTIGALAAHAVVDTDAAEPDSAHADAARTEADQDPVDVAPWPLVHRARRSGVDPSSLVLTESVPVPDGLDPDTVAQRLAAVVEATPALRVRVTPKSRLRWKVEVCPPGAAPAPGRLDSVSVADALDVTEARTVAFALRDGELILAAHGLCLDRWSLHELAVAVAAGTEPFASTAGVVEVGARLDESARSDDADTHAREYADTVAQFPSRDDGSAAVPERTQHWERTLTDVPVEPGAVRDVVVHALSEAVHPGAIDVEVDLRPLAAGDGAAGAWTASAPVPVAGDAWFPLVGFGNSTGRKLLGKMPSASAFVTRAYGEQVDATRREGVESLYPVVVRYTVPGGESVGRRSVRFDVFGPATLDGDALLDRVAGELGAPVAVR